MMLDMDKPIRSTPTYDPKYIQYEKEKAEQNRISAFANNNIYGASRGSLNNLPTKNQDKYNFASRDNRGFV
jgi:hypothetical protein